jgi:nitrous oxidase accessory protein NosD
VPAGEALAPLLEAGGDYTLADGIWTGPLVVTRSVTLRGAPGTVIDAGGHGPVVTVADDDLEVVLVGLTLRNGHAEGGAGVRLTGWSRVRMEGCTVLECRAPGNTGGGVAALRGSLDLVGCTFLGNRAAAGSDVLATGVAEVRVRGGRFAGDLALREGARVVLDGVVCDGVVDVRATTTRAPHLRHMGCTFGGGLRNDAQHPGIVVEDEDA